MTEKQIIHEDKQNIWAYIRKYTWHFIPDIQTYEVSPRENVVSTEHHSNVCHQDVLQNGENINSAVFCLGVFNYNFKQICSLPWCSPQS